ncbi:hypothetical protein BDW02DRAFT_574048 [Decorospora gaudefroyi]|uniref:Uncharacterized protein n=1 Tax=Decorospora gaudefroyi TaxID=184978 RepID=A0A6A5JYG8_9PLEO|nr:hypothetical protein BDW02DRAFT_574048 [Decorospora gaudefroyi]
MMSCLDYRWGGGHHLGAFGDDVGFQALELVLSFMNVTIYLILYRHHHCHVTSTTPKQKIWTHPASSSPDPLLLPLPMHMSASKKIYIRYSSLSCYRLNWL